MVFLHDPFWAPLKVTEAAHALGAEVVAVHHGSAALDAAGMPGPSGPWERVFRAWLRHAYAPVDAIASVVDPEPDCGREASFPLRLGLHDAFRPQKGVARGDHVLYVGRLAREKGVFRLLEAARSHDPEAGASGARVVACATAPSAQLLGGLAHLFSPGDTGGLAAAIAAARFARRDPAAPAALCWRLRWDRLFAEELDDLRGLAA